MFFTREDILKIQNALLQLSVKDSELPSAEPVTYDDTLSIVQDGKNKQIKIEDFFNQISLWKREDFINITDKYDEHYISLIEAINLVPILQRKDGLVITFQDIEGNWEIYQFRDNITEFFNVEKWFNLYDYRNNIVQSIVPDEEDLTASIPDENGNSLVSLKDRVYDPISFSGKGYKILRKNVQSVNIAVTKIRVEFSPSADGTLSFSINGKETQIAISATTDKTTVLVAQKVASALQESMTEYDVLIDASLITLTRKFGGSVTSSAFSASTTGVVCTVTDSTKQEPQNILMPTMMNQPNTIYVIKYDFDLNGKTIEMQEGCTLKFEGGCFKNGILKGNNTHIVESKVQLFDSIILRGSFDVPFLYYDNFGVIADTEDNNNSDIINKTNDFIKSTNINTLTFASSLYYINKQIVIELNPREETLNMIGHSVTIKATENFSEDYLLRINYTSFGTTTKTLINGLTFNCNVLTGGINIPNGNCIKIHNVAITNVGVNKNGILISSGNELHFANSRITGNNKGKCFGICFHTSDCSADNIIMIDVKTAIYQSGSSNIYSDIHAWVSSPQNFQGSEFLLIGGGAAYLDRCSCDTYQIAIYSISNPYISFTNSSFFQNTNVVTASGETSASIIIAENLKAFYSFTGCNMPSFDFQHFSNNDTEIKKYCNFIGSNILGTYYPFTGIKEIPYAKYDDYYGRYVDGIVSSNTMRAIPAQIGASNGHLYRFFNINDYMGKSYNFFCEWYGNPIFFMVSCLNNTIHVRSIFGNPPVKFFIKDGIFYIYCPKIEHTPYNILLAVGIFGFTDMGENTPNNSYTEIICDKIIGNSTERPSNIEEGYEYYDNTLKKKILWNGTAWVNLDGSSLDIKKSGATDARPTNVNIGFIYKDTTLNKLILWEGTKWVNLDGSELS